MKFFSSIEKTVNVVGASILVVLMLITFVDVIGRTLFNNPLNGAVELTELLLGMMVFLLLPSATLHQDHISVDIIDSFAGKILDAVRNILTSLIGVAFFSLIAWRMWEHAQRSSSYHETTNNLGIPIAPFVYGLSILSGLTAIMFLILLFKMRTRTESAEMEAARRMADSSTQ
jgi:TRAP-type C4-dicarboxylate transport system permease small subunit